MDDGWSPFGALYRVVKGLSLELVTSRKDYNRCDATVRHLWEIGGPFGASPEAGTGRLSARWGKQPDERGTDSMTLLDNLLGGLQERNIVVALSILAAFMALAMVAWLLTRRAATCRPLAVEHRAWTYCPVCGRPRPTDSSVTPPKPQGRPIRDAVITQVPALVNDNPSPSDLLRQGWTRAAALDKDGRIVTPCNPSAVAWSIWGAVNLAYEPGGDVWKASVRHLADIITEIEGGRAVSVQQWNRAVNRTHREILSVADEVQRRLGFEFRSK